MRGEEVLDAAFDALEGSDPLSDPRRGDFPLRGLLADVRVEVNDETPTLEIQAIADGYILRIGRRFSEEYVLTGDDAVAVIVHEVFHKLRGHLNTPHERHPGLRSLQNLVMDVLVNSLLGRVLLGPQPPIFRRLYPPTEWPAAMLLSPPDLLPFTDARPDWVRMDLDTLQAEARMTPAVDQEVSEAVGRHFASLGVRHAEAFGRAYTRGWLHFPDPAGYWDLLRALFVAELGSDPAPVEALLLGSHGQGDGSMAREDCGDLSGTLDSMVEAAQSTFLQAVPAAPSREQLDRFGRQVVVALDRDAGGSASTHRTETITTPIPMAGRRDLTWIALGQYPALWHPVRRQTLPTRRGIRVYIDVSGSMEDLCPLLFALTRALGPRLDLPVWCWSLGEPQPMTEGDLETGRYRTAYGTEVAPVLSHARERGFKRILVLTDGEFFVGSSLAALVEEAGLEITFVVPARSCAQHLRPIAKHVFSLEG